MGTSEDDAREAMISALMSGGQEAKDRFIISTLLDIKQNGCTKACDVRPTATQTWGIPAMAGTGAGVFVAAMWETIKAKLLSGDTP